MMAARKGIYNQSASLGLGITQLMIGLFSIAVGLQAYLAKAAYSYIFFGVWCGAIFVLAGLFAIICGTRQNINLVALNTAVSGFAIAGSLAQLVLASFGLYYNVSEKSCPECAAVAAADRYCTIWTDKSTECLDYNNYLVTVWDGSVLIILAAINVAVSFSVVSLSCPCCQIDNLNKVGPADIERERVEDEARSSDQHNVLTTDSKDTQTEILTLCQETQADITDEPDLLLVGKHCDTFQKETQTDLTIDPSRTDDWTSPTGLVTAGIQKNANPDLVYADTVERTTNQQSQQMQQSALSLPKWLEQRMQPGSATWNPAYSTPQQLLDSY